MPRAIAPQMASKDRNEEYARLKAEFDTMQAEMDALGIGASSKKLEEFEVWRRRRAAKRKNLLCHARRDNSRAIDRAEKAAAAAAASEARSSSANAGPSVRGHSTHPFSTARATHDPFDCAAFRVKDGARPSVASRARDRQLAPGRRQASAALD